MMKYLEGGVLIEGRIYSSGSSSVRKPVAARPLPLSLSKILIARVAALHNFVMHPVNARYHLSHGEGTHVGVLRHSLSYPVTAQLRAYVSLIDWNYPRNLYAARHEKIHFSPSLSLFPSLVSLLTPLGNLRYPLVLLRGKFILEKSPLFKSSLHRERV